MGSGVEFTTEGTSNSENGKVAGALETKYKFKEHGLTFTEKWNTDNKLSTKVDLQDKIMKGLKLTLDTSFSPQTGAKTGVLKTEYKHDLLTVNTETDLTLDGPTINDSAVNVGWVASKNETSFGIGCKYALDGSASIRAKVNNSSHVGLGYQQKLRDGITLTLSTLIDGKNFQQGGHKVGLALELEA